MPAAASTRAVSFVKSTLPLRPSRPTTTPRDATSGTFAFKYVASPAVVRMTTARFIRFGPAPMTPRRPAVPNSNFAPKRSAISFSSPAFNSASSSARVASSGSSSRQRSAVFRSSSGIATVAAGYLVRVTMGAVLSLARRTNGRSRSFAWTGALALALLVGCGSAEKQAVSSPSTKPNAAAIRARLDHERVTTSTFPRKVLWSWTKDKGGRWLATIDPPRLLRVEIRKHPPDDAWYDVHLRGSDDDELRALLTSPRFDHARWAWTDVWGACDGVESERYGDQLVRIELKDDAIFAVFVPKTDDGLAGAM